MIASMPSGNGSVHYQRSRGPLGWVLDFFSSVWVGIVWLVLLFIYCSIGSALPQFRQLPALEMTEFQWFHWWPFDVLIALFCTSLVVVTLRKIQLSWVNAGVWLIHTGIIILCIGSVVYFGLKEEGDAPVFRRSVKIEMPGMDKPVRMVAIPGSKTSAIVGPDMWRFEIQDTNNSWPILSDENKGEKAYAINVMVKPPTGEPFIRQLLAGYPQYTEDVMPGKGRAIKAIGKKLVDENLQLSLDYEPTEYFHLMDTWALFVRKVGDKEWIQRPIHGMGRYHDRVASRELVFTEPNEPFIPRPIDINVPSVNDADPLKNASMRVTGYLRYAQEQRRWRDGGDRLFPVVKVTALSPQGNKSYELVALDRERNHVENGVLEFRWLKDSQDIATLPKDSRAKLIIDVPSTKHHEEKVMTAETVVGREGEFTKIAGTDFSYRIINVQDGLTIPNRDGVLSIAMVEIETPEGRFTRMVADQADMTRDMHGAEADPHATNQRVPKEPDGRIVMTYEPASAPIILAAHPNGLHMIVNGQSGRTVEKPVAVGDVTHIVDGLDLRIDSLITNAIFETKPYVVPMHERQKDARETFSMIRLEMDTGNGTQSRWLNFNQYALPNEQYAYMGRMGYQPERFRMPDGSWVEVMFSRERKRLPNPIALESFDLQTHVGGFTGSALTIFNYVSQLRFLDHGKWTETSQIAVNAPTNYGGYWYFQSTWDRPMSGNPQSGMNFTGLGVGNRHGVYTQLAGCCIATFGMFYAFYVKPILKRRRAEQARSQSGVGREVNEEAPAADSMRETATV